MSPAAPQDTSQSALSAMPEESTAGSTPSPRVPFRARFVQFRQRLILRVRFWFRLPIDDVKEYLDAQEKQATLANQQRVAEVLDAQTQAIAYLSERLKFYEKHIPRMRELKRTFEVEYAAKKNRPKEEQQMLDHGVLPMRPTNGALQH